MTDLDGISARPLLTNMKQILRRWAPRTEEQLLSAAKAAFAAISAADCQGFFLNAQYATSFMVML